MYRHKIIQVWGSAGITIPKKFLEVTGLCVGQQIAVEIDTKYKTLLIKPIHLAANNYFLSPEYFKWLTEMNKKLKRRV